MTDPVPPPGSRAAHKRGPKTGSRPDVLEAQAERVARHDRIVADLDGPDRYLASFDHNYSEETADSLYFRMTRGIVVAARRWRKLANERVKAVDQTMARWETLFLVAFSDEELTQSDLARLISIEGPTLVRMLDVLAREGLIERRQSASDRRVTVNTITPAGRQVIDEIMGVTNVLRAEVLRDIPKAELEVALRVISKIILRINEIR